MSNFKIQGVRPPFPTTMLVLIFTYGHKSWVMTERMISQAVE